MLKYTNNNKKGFTLIELLVTVALLVSVLAIVIISVTNVSKKQKENAKEQVKEQAMTAAEQYFSTNEYLFEGMADGTTAKIPIGKLVDEGFLNVLTDPKTGKKLNNCDSIEVTKQKGKYITKYVESTLSVCDDKYLVSVAEPKPTTTATTTTVTTTKTTATTTTTTTEVITTLDNTAPLVTVNIYKRNDDGSKGDLLTTKIGSGIDISEGKNRIYVNDENWMNKSDFPNGIYVEYYANEDLKSSTWYWNKQGLTKSTAISDDYKWYSGEGYRSGNYSSDGKKSKEQKDGHNFSGDGSRRARIYVKDLKGNETKFYIVAYFDKVIDKPTINLNSTKEIAEDVTFTLVKPSDQISGISNTQYSYDKKTWNNYSSRVTLLTTTGTKKVYARAVDNAGNVSSVVEVTGKCDKDGVKVGFAGNGMPFKLPISLKYPSAVSGITANKYEYYYWNAESTSDTTSDADAGGRAAKLEECKSSFNNIKDTYKAKTTTNGEVTLYAKSKKQYYCFAIRPYRTTEISGINRWTIQGKHSEFSGNITSSKYNGVGTTAGNYVKK